MTRRDLMQGVAASCWPSMPVASRSFWVLGLLMPKRLQIAPVSNGRLYCRSDDRNFIVEAGSFLSLDAHSRPLRVTNPRGEATALILRVPGELERSYYGVLDVSSGPEYLVPVIRIDIEIATGSIVAAELPVSAAPFDAQAAQAVVSSSILLDASQPRHLCADFCDTTHCQFLRSPVMPGSETARAVDKTRRLVLMQDGCGMAPRYSAACGGFTEAGMNRGQRYTSVRCEICASKNLVRRGHGWGLCQEGAIGLARRGWTWRQILATYYPDAEIRCAGRA
jgi:peptidoglycan hydrolase-like amidase